MSNLASLFLTSLKDETIILPDGFSGIEIENTGKKSMYIYSNKRTLNAPKDENDPNSKSKALTPEPREIKAGGKFQLPRSERGRNGFKVECLGTSCNLTLEF